MKNEHISICPECSQTTFGTGEYCMEHQHLATAGLVDPEHPEDTVYSEPDPEFQTIGMTEICILEIILEKGVGWKQQYDLLEHYRAVIHPQFFQLAAQVIFDTLIKYIAENYNIK